MAETVDISDVENEFTDSIASTSSSFNETLISELASAEEPPSRKRSRKNQSCVWRWFSKKSREQSCCTVCHKKMKMTAGSTTSLTRHMATFHKEVYNNTDIEAKNSSTNTSTNTTTKTREGHPVTISMLDKNTPRAVELTNAIARMIVLDFQPFSLLSDKGFRGLLQVAEPRFNIPNRTTFSQDIIPAMYVKEKKKVADTIHSDVTTGNVQSLAFTTDGWTSRTNKSYISLSVHYVTNEFRIKNFTLRVQPYKESHTGDNLYKILSNNIREWGLNNPQIRVYFVTDNAANVVRAVKLGSEWKRIPCFAHTLQLVVKDGIKSCKDLRNLLNKCQRIVRFFHRSVPATQQLEREQKRDSPDLKPLRLIGDVETRWNSQFDMMDRLLQVRRALNAVLGKQRMPMPISRREWCMIQDYCDSLKIFKEATQVTTIEDQPTLCRYIPTVYGLKKILATPIEKKRATPDGIRLRNNLLLSLNTRFQFIDSNKTLVIAMLLDPRIKDRILTEKKKVSAHMLLHSALMEYGGANEVDAASSTVDVPPKTTSVSTSPASLGELFSNIVKDEKPNINDEVCTIDKELMWYYEEKLIPTTSCILKWWNDNSRRFPKLANLAQQFLGIPATEAYSERLFSTAGNIVTAKRTSLMSEKIEQICFLSANLRKKEIEQI